jgi:hypothetical protein
MATAKIHAGICGFRTTAAVGMADDGMHCAVRIDSDCPHVTAMGEELQAVNAFEEIAFSGDLPATFRAAAKHCPHAACPVPAGIIKAIEVAAGLALPADAHIEIRAD